MLNLSAEHRANLLRMAAYLRSGALGTDFGMESYEQGSDEYNLSTHCGSVGCVIGHGSIAIRRKRSGESWRDFCHSLFGINVLRQGDGAWSWMFNSSWSRVDNTPEGAAARIEWFLANGVPENWEAQLYRGEPLCYSILPPLVDLPTVDVPVPQPEKVGAV